MLMLSGILMASCQTTGSNERTINTAAFCDVAEPFWWSKKDTVKTIVQAKKWNRIGKMCGWR
jgi:hypothetical protein